eukprot:SAG31_NODE_293_length_18292_cov_8.779586_6_plen_487_part_00
MVLLCSDGHRGELSTRRTVHCRCEVSTTWDPPGSQRQSAGTLASNTCVVTSDSPSIPPGRYWNNNPPENGTSAVLRYLAAAHARGVSVVLELPRRWVVGESCGGGAPCLAKIHELVHAVSSHPAIGGWYMADEPDRPEVWIEPAALGAIARTVRAAESSAAAHGRHPIVAVFCRLQQPGNASHASNYNSSVDVYALDVYPCRCTPGWHSSPSPLFGGDAFSEFPAQIRDAGQLVAPQFHSFWMVLQGSLIDSAADHDHYCNSSKCWSAGWRECAPLEIRYQLYAAMLSGVRGLMFYRLGLRGWQQSQRNVDAPLNQTWVQGSLIPALAELAPRVSPILAGPVAGLGINVSDTTVAARLYLCKPSHDSKSKAPVAVPTRPDCRWLLIALRWSDDRGTLTEPSTVPRAVRFEFTLLGAPGGSYVAVRVDERGMPQQRLAIQRSSSGSVHSFVDTLMHPGSVNVYEIEAMDPHALAQYARFEPLITRNA